MDFVEQVSEDKPILDRYFSLKEAGVKIDSRFFVSIIGELFGIKDKSLYKILNRFIKMYGDFRVLIALSNMIDVDFNEGGGDLRRFISLLSFYLTSAAQEENYFDDLKILDRQIESKKPIDVRSPFDE